MTESIELLSTDDDGNAIEGPKYPLDSSAVKWLDEDQDIRLAYPHKFFKYGRDRQPLEHTLVKFLVPDYLCDGPNPSREALRLVGQRMGWE